MGGFGSGNYSRVKQRYVDDLRAIDVRYMARSNLIDKQTAGRLFWSLDGKQTASIDFTFSDHCLCLYFKVTNYLEEQKVTQKIRLSYSRCHLGGERPWFLCPVCSSRRAKLYLGAQRFVCRACLQVSYRTSGQSRRDRIIAMKHQIGRRIFASYENGVGRGKKKGMHQATFDRLYRRYQRLENQYSYSLDRLLNRVAH